MNASTIREHTNITREVKEEYMNKYEIHPSFNKTVGEFVQEVEPMYRKRFEGLTKEQLVEYSINYVVQLAILGCYGQEALENYSDDVNN